VRRPSERLECPEDFQQHLTDLFGVNRFGEPLFRIIWGQTETQVQLTVDGKYDRVLLGHNQPCWILQRWEPPEVFGTPDHYYFLNRDPESGDVMMEYPEFGNYTDLVTFQSKNYDAATKELYIETVTLDWSIIEHAFPLIFQTLEMSAMEIESAREQQEAYENSLAVERIADRLYDELPSFYGPTSHAQIANRTALIDRKMAEIEQEWRKHKLRLPPARGFYQGKPN